MNTAFVKEEIEHKFHNWKSNICIFFCQTANIWVGCIQHYFSDSFDEMHSQRLCQSNANDKCRLPNVPRSRIETEINDIT